MKKIGLVLGGGGGRGAYHIGVWKYLKESGIYDKVNAISGNSVGALNSCLIAMNDYEAAEKVWIKEIETKILTPKKIKDYFKIEKYSIFGIFSREGLIEVIDKYIDLNLLSNYHFNIYASCTEYNAPFFIKSKYFKLNGNSTERIKKILLATSALVTVFPTEKIDDKFYLDGCYTDDCPIEPLYLYEDCTDIIVIHLDYKKPVKKKDNVNIYEMYPSKDLGNFFKGVLDFSPKGAEIRIEQGYNDAKNYFKDLSIFQ
ncbi:MAG TPA: patatin-like phospholipase family protein [Brachyspira hyodysenteriae]|nr:patatin-like phospholipase family protein [Brachyspira hyodysenteriae]